MPLFRKTKVQPVTRVSVIIPVRNEAGNIQELLRDLEAQTYPDYLFEVLILNDHSEDETAVIVSRFSELSNLNIRLINLHDYAGLRQKKAAIALGVKHASGELIIQTDGDCRVKSDWLSTIAHFYEQTGAKCISGPVCLTGKATVFIGMQVVEFACLIGVGGASIAMGKPNMCNGANFAYNREAFFAVQGFEGNDHLASGDDEFLMHKLAEHYPEEVYFLKAPEAIVYTGALTSFKSFLNQRVRWASKWPNYRKVDIKALAITVFGINFLLFVCLGFWIAHLLPSWQIMVLYGLKFLTDSLFLASVLRFFNLSRLIIYIIPLQFVYIPYVLFTALLGLRGSYQWKGRQVS